MASLSMVIIFLTCTFYTTFASSSCSDIEHYTTVANELAELGLEPDSDEFEVTMRRANQRIPGRNLSPECIRFLVRTYIAKLRAEYPAEDVQRYLIKVNADFTPPEECENPEGYEKLGQELAVLGPNPDFETTEAITDKYPDLSDEDNAACVRVMRNAYRKAYKEAGFYDTLEGQRFVNRIDTIGYILEDSSEKRR